MHLEPVNVRSSESAKNGCAKRVENEKMVKPPETFFKKIAALIQLPIRGKKAFLLLIEAQTQLHTRILQSVYIPQRCVCSHSQSIH